MVPATGGEGNGALYRQIIADIAVAAAAAGPDGQPVIAVGADYVPGSARMNWLAQTPDDFHQHRVLATASAAASALMKASSANLLCIAMKWGIPLDAATAHAMAEHFQQRRDAWLAYRR